MIKINNANFISELGKRNNNEDNYAINPNKTYIVCDGVGGSEKGEIASDIVVKEFIHQFDINSSITANEVIKHVEAEISKYISNHPDSMGMATTLTLAHIKNDSIYIAWCGDSRIYQFRNGNIIYKTIDHSWVNEAVKAGIITEEEAINHPKSNVITRAIQGSHKPVLIDDVSLTDIQVNDMFLMCSDGILESWSDADLIALFTSFKNVDEILQKIKTECAVNSRDNFTAIVFKLDEVSIRLNNVIEESRPNFVNSESSTDQDISHKKLQNEIYDENKKQKDQSNDHNSKKKILSSVLVLLLLLLTTIFVYFNFFNTNEKNTQIQNSKDQIINNETKQSEKENKSNDEKSKIKKDESKDGNEKDKKDKSRDEKSNKNKD